MSSMRDRPRPTAGPASITCWPAPSRTSSRATRPCAATSSRGRAAGTPTACRSSSRSRRSWVSRGKKAIEDFGVTEFNRLCRQSVFDYVEDWEKLTERMGYWVDLPTAYRTYTNDYVESLWWILKQYWDRGLIYQGYKVVPYCPRCGTPLSSHELAQGYQEGTRGPERLRQVPAEGPAGRRTCWSGRPRPGRCPATSRSRWAKTSTTCWSRRARAPATTSCGWPRRCSARCSSMASTKAGPTAGAAQGQGQGAARPALQAALHLPARHPGLLLRDRGRLRQHGGRHGPGPHRAGVRRGRHGGRPQVRSADAHDGGRAGPLHRRGRAVARAFSSRRRIRSSSAS